MDALQLRIEEDLRGQISGDVRCDDLFAQLYAADASVFEIRPLGVVRPRTVEDVASVVRYASETGLALYPRGGGSGLAGDSLGRGLILDFSRFFRRILAIESDRVVVQAGVVLAQLDERLAATGRVLGPDPAASQVTTIGSMIALDAAGSHWPAHGSMRDRVRELEVVLADGQVVRLRRRHPVLDADAADAADPADRLAAGVRRIVEQHRTPLADRAAKSLVDRTGYRLHDAVHDDGVDLAGVVVGSEGTLALVTEAVLQPVVLPSHVGAALFCFSTLTGAAEAAVELAGGNLRACDLMDRRLLSVARENDPRLELLIPPEVEAVLLVECGGATLAELHDRLRAVEDFLLRERKLASAARLAEDRDDFELLWQLARRFAPTLNRLRGVSRPVPYVEDIAVPPAKLPQFLTGALDALRRLQFTSSVFAHALQGQVHIRPFANLAEAGEGARLRELAEELYAIAWRCEGTVSGEHGEGYSRTEFSARQNAACLPAYRQTKSLFDPRWIFNPGKKTPHEQGAAAAPLRHVGFAETPSAPAGSTEPSRQRSITRPQLAWTPEDISYAARTCNGCAMCRTQSPGTRMCPINRFSPREEASPRAKANLLRGILAGELPAETLWEDACKQIVDLCVHCHMCRLECPSNVDVPRMMVEARASHVAVNGLPYQERALAQVDRLLSIGSRMSRLANWAIGNRVARWALEKTLGIAQGRKLPRFRRRPFLQSATQRSLGRMRRGQGEKALLFIDSFANYCDPDLAEALVRVLQHNGVSVYVPEGQLESAMPLVARGLVGPARKTAERNVALLAEGVRQGYSIVSSEPSAVLALSREYLQLLGDDHDAALVSQNVFEACHYLWRLHQRGRLQLSFRPVDWHVAVHVPCHVKALEIGHPAYYLLGLIPGLRIQVLEKGCSGMAGTFGLSKRNYRSSLRAGLPLISALREGPWQAGVTECSACRIQMEQSTTFPTIHPVKLLAYSYGLLPELAASFSSPTDPLVVK